MLPRRLAKNHKKGEVMPNPLEGLITRQDIAGIAESEGLILDDEDRISVLESMRSIDVQACPGSGKTTLIATKLLLLAKKWQLSQQGICVLSHTNVAKDEIIERLKRTKTIEAKRLLSYPHFIGTIQEFVGKFVAFPLIRSKGIKIKHVDTDNCVGLIYANLQRGTRAYIDNRSRFSNVLYDFDLIVQDGNLSINVPTFPNGSNSQSYTDLKAVRERMIAEGYFFYKDIYAFAEMALFSNDQIKSVLRERFKLVFLDEMQDTQKFQDELLLKIFPLNDPTMTVQRFGDSDQAIFHGISGEEPNESYNGKSAANMDVVINKSHRFDNNIAAKIRNLSYNEVQLETELSVDGIAERIRSASSRGGFDHTVIIYNDRTRGDVIPTFANIVSRQFAADYKSSAKFTVKAVGAVGNEIEPNGNQLKIGHFWDGYDKAKSKNNFKEDSLIEAIWYCRKSCSLDWDASYRMLIDCLLRLLRKAEKKDGNGRYFSATSLQDFLKASERWDRCRNLIHSMLNDTCLIDQVNWTVICQELLLVLDLSNISAEAIEYLAFCEEGLEEAEQDARAPTETLTSLPENMILHPDGFRIELSTIHGVKGETHDATLVLETKNHCFDLEAMIPYLTGDLPSDEHPNGSLRPNPSRASFSPNQKFMRQFYVAMSRPKHLLCLAIHSDRISTAQKTALEGLGWNVRELPPPAQEGIR